MSAGSIILQRQCARLARRRAAAHPRKTEAAAARQAGRQSSQGAGLGRAVLIALRLPMSGILRLRERAGKRQSTARSNVPSNATAHTSEMDSEFQLGHVDMRGRGPDQVGIVVQHTQPQGVRPWFQA